MQQRIFEQHLAELLRAQVVGLSTHDKQALVRRHADLLGSGADGFTAGIEPFVPGRRPADELAFPGLGSSESVALYNPSRKPDDTLTVLLRCYQGGRPAPDFPKGAAVLGTLQVLDAQGKPAGVLAGWDRRDLRPLLRRPDTPTSAAGVPPAHLLVLDVEATFAPEAVPVPPERYLGFATLLHQRFRLLLDVEMDGARVAGGHHDFEVHNEQLFGSLYQRLVDVLLPWDVQRQGAPGGIAAHPWYPVLCIGMQKARLYMLAVTGDLVEQKRMLTDPGWLLRVGLYLELLTCLGVAEAVRGEIDLLTTGERRALETAPEYAEIRDRLDVKAWKQVWALRDVAPTGPLNLLRKKNATLAFLHAHHEDLKHAIDLAGPNLQNAQETWHRVFRDAERAVLQMNADAFPELAQLPVLVKEFALWHQSGGLAGLKLLPSAVTEAFGDQDGVFPSACRQYRASMNHIAAWARERGLMEYTGEECVPVSSSLLEAYLAGQHGRVASIQRHDGFAGKLEVVVEEAAAPAAVDRKEVVSVLGTVELFSVLTVDELHALAERVRPIHLAHLERIIVQGRAGSSLFLLQEGTLEVVRRDQGQDRQIALLRPPAVVGELAFLMGEKRSATVRALEGATVLEVGAILLRPLVEQRPALLDKLRRLLEDRRRANAQPVDSKSLLAGLHKAIFGKTAPLSIR